MPTEVSTGQTAKLNGREQVAEGTMAFYFEKPNGFEFRAGQAIDVTLLDPRKQTPKGTSVHFPSRVRRLKMV
jgi:ferredoxin-NADP reductase